MKIGVSSYCFGRLFSNPGYTLFSVIEDARKIGFDAIEFTEFGPPEGKNVKDFAAELRKACEAAGLTVSNYAVGADFVNGSDGNSAKEVARVREQVDIAKSLGAACMRHDATGGFRGAVASSHLSYQDAITHMAPYIREVTEYAAGLGIKTMCENHGIFMQNSARVEELVRTVNHPNFGLLVDMGNFMCADETSVTALATVMPYAFHIHAKDFLWKPGTEQRPDDSWFHSRGGNLLRGTILGHGAVSAAQCIAYIKNTGYAGTLSLEFEGPEDTLDAIRRGYAFMTAHTRPNG